MSMLHVDFRDAKSMLLSMLYVHAACSFYMSILHAHAACPHRISTLHVHSACPYCMSMMTLNIHVDPSYSCGCCIFMWVLHDHVDDSFSSMPHVHFDAACPSQCCMPMSVLHAHVFAACPCPSCMSMSVLLFYIQYLLHVHVIARCMSISQCCMFMLCPRSVSMLNGNAACLFCISMLLLLHVYAACP
jgi:hypothetical protein